MNKKLKIIQLGDTHIFNIKRHNVHINVFKKLYDMLDVIQPDYIVHGGDLLDSFIISNEAEIMAGEFLKELAKRVKYKVYITSGNHEYNLKSLNKINSLEPIITLMDDPKIVYMDKSGFYEEKQHDLVFVNYFHIDKFKGIDPWHDDNILIPDNIEDKVTIGVFHDPIYASTTMLTKTQFNDEKYKPINYFDNNTILMAADIHHFQYLREDKTAAYCGSTLQLEYGEEAKGGFIIWDIEGKDNISSTYTKIPNEYNYINLYIHKDYNYDAIDLDDEHITPYSEIKVHWVDYTAYVNFGNERKIRKYIKDKWNIDKVKFERENIHTDVNDIELLNEKINVLDASEQTKIFTEFLKANKFSNTFIKSVLKIDSVISSNLDIADNLGITWSIDKFWFNNFKSYGDDNVINWEGKDGIYTIHGENKQGKTTIIDAISYILYGKTQATVKRIKNGDVRFLNNKRQLDTVNGGAVLTINGEKYTVIRETTRKYNKTRTGVASCTSTVEYYNGDEELVNDKLTGEQKKDTQKLIDAAIGTFDDYIRLVSIDNDNLNDILSTDRSKLIDSLIYDSGLDIFDKKLTEFKEYRKDILSKRKTINIDEIIPTIGKIELKKTDIEFKLKNLVNDITKLEETKKLYTQIKEGKIKQLERIDEKLKNIDLVSIKSDIKKEEEIIEKNTNKLNDIKILKNEISTYDEAILENKILESSILNDEINKMKLDISEYNKKISDNNNELKLLTNDINTNIKNFVNDLTISNKDIDMDIMKIKEDFSNNINEYLSKTNQSISDAVDEQSKIYTEIDRLMVDGKKIKTENDELETSTVCITCKRPLDGIDMSAINSKIESNRVRMSNIKGKIDELKPIHEKIGEKVTNFREILIKIKKRDYSFDTELLNVYNDSKNKISILKNDIKNNIEKIELIKNNDLPSELSEILVLSYKRNDELTLIITDLEKNVNILSNKLKTEESKYNILKSDVEKLNKIKNDINQKKEIISMESKFILNVENSKSLISKHNLLIDNNLKELTKIDNNKLINIEINKSEDDIVLLDTELSSKNEEKVEYQSSIKIFDNEVEQLEADIVTHRRYKKEDEVMSTYMKCVHRDGLPTFLLKKSIHVINREMYKLLNGVDFVVYFDDDLNLKMSNDNRLDAEQYVIEGSGMERTFASLVLKTSIRKINNKSKPNFILLDEIMTKLTGESVEEFTILLDNIKNDVDKLVIIEHIHPIDYDALIVVEKNIEGISSLKVTY